MKRKQSRLTIIPRAATVLANQEVAAAGVADSVLNMRERERSLQVAGNPASCGTIAAGSKILLIHRTTFGERMLTCAGSQVACGDVQLAVLPGEPAGACAVGDFAVVAHDGGLCALRATAGGYDVLDPDAALPQISIVEAEPSTLTATVAACAFEQPYASWPARLTTADAAALRSRLKGAWASITAQAAASGQYVGPVLARYGVRLYDDTYLWVSAPVLLGGATVGERRLTADVQVTDGKFAGVPAAELAVSAYRLGVSVHSGISAAWHGVVKSVDLLVADAVAPFDASAPLDYRAAASVGTSRRSVLEYGLKPVAVSRVSTAAMAGQWRVAASCTRLGRLDSGVFAAGNMVKSTSRPIDTAVCYALASPLAVSATLTPQQLGGAEGRAGRRLLPSAVMASGGRLMAGVAGWKMVDTWGVAQFCTAASAGGCTATVTATLATSHGAATVVRSERLAFVPQQLPPMVFYPDSRAVALRVQVEADSGDCTAWEAELSPAWQLNAAVVCSSSLGPHKLASSSAVAAVAAGVVDPALGTVAASVQGNPFVAAGTHTVGGDAVEAMAVASRPVYSSGFGRYPVYVFTRAGVYALPQLTSGGYGEARLLHRSPMAAGGRPAEAGDSVCYVDASGRLCRLRGSERRVMLSGVDGQSQLAYSQAFDELAVLSPQGMVRQVHLDSARAWQRSLSAGSLYGGDGRAIAVTLGGELLDLDVEQAAESQPVYYRSMPIELLDGDPCRPTSVMWRIAASGAQLRLGVNGERGVSCHGFTVGGVSVSGTVGAPVVQRLVSPPLRTVRLVLSGTLPSASLVQPVTIVAQRLS